MWGRLAEVDISDNGSLLIKPDLFEAVSEDKPELLSLERLLVFSHQKIGVVLMGLKRLTDRDVVFDLGRCSLGNRNQSLLFELGLLDIDRAIIFSIMIFHQLQGF